MNELYFGRVWRAPFSVRYPLFGLFVAGRLADIVQTALYWRYESNPVVLAYGLPFMVAGASAWAVVLLIGGIIIERHPHEGLVYELLRG